MEKREFNLTIYIQAKDWHIELDGVESFDSFHPLGGDIKYTFAKSRSCEDKKLSYLFNHTMNETDIELAKEDIRFKELVKFNVKVLGLDDRWENKKCFDGTFCDALEYIKEELK